MSITLTANVVTDLTTVVNFETTTTFGKYPNCVYILCHLILDLIHF